MQLREAFDGVPDHRSSQGRRYLLGAILSLAVWAMLCGARSRVCHLPVGAGPGNPHRATHGVLAEDSFETVLGEWLRNNEVEPGEVLSVIRRGHWTGDRQGH